MIDTAYPSKPTAISSIESKKYVSQLWKSVINACIAQDINALREYYKAGVNFNDIRDQYGDSLLHIAIMNDKPQSFNALLNLGMNIEVRSYYDNSTPLNMAAMADELSYVQLLLDKGANVNARTIDGSTPLTDAIYNGCEDVAKVLLSNPKVDVNIPTNSGIPPILWAFDQDNLELADQIAHHPSFDVEYNLILLNDFETYDIKEYLLTLAPENNNLTLLDTYQVAKVFALRYEFNGCIELKDIAGHGYNCFDLDGYANRLGALAMAESFTNFYDTVVYNSTLPAFAHQTFIDVTESLLFSASVFEPEAYLSKINQGDLVIIPSGWDGHSITFVIQGDTLYRCNRGHMSDGIHGIEEFLITKPNSLTVDVLDRMIEADGNHNYLQNQLIDVLGLHKIGEIENPTQIIGNCVWTSLEAGIEASFVASFMNYGVDPVTAHILAKDTFLLFEDFDLNYALKDVIEHPESLAQNEIFDDLVIYALENHHNPFSESDILKGVVILDQLDDPLVFETFDHFIGQDLIKYDPNCYKTISYMEPYTPGYFEYFFGSAPKPYFTESQKSELAQMEAFLKACDEYRLSHQEVLNITDILQVSDTKPLENIFSSFVDEIVAPKLEVQTVPIPLVIEMPQVIPVLPIIQVEPTVVC